MEDHELLEKILDPESRNYGFNLLVRKYQERIYWIIRKMVIDHDDANDVTQEVFIKVWKNLDKFRAEAQIFTWVYRIATNECLNFLNKKRKRFFVAWAEDLDLDPRSLLRNVVNHEDVLARRQRRRGLLQLSTHVLLFCGGRPSFVVESD